MNIIDSFLNKITMYRLTLYGLSVIAAISIVAAFFSFLPFTGLELAISLLILLATAYISNSVFALFTKATPTGESAFITALILFFVLTPVQSTDSALMLMLAAVVAMASKYIFAWKGKHIFNPAAFSALILSVLGTGLASWWVATPVLFPFVLLIGLLVVRKIRRFDMFFAFVLIAVVAIVTRTVLAGAAPVAILIQLALSWPLAYFATFMLTEPQTAPQLPVDRLIYAAIVALLFSITFTVGPLSATPELALIIGNIFAFAVSMKRRVKLTFRKSSRLSKEVYEFVFEPNKPFAFAPGQYMEWTVPHRSADNRGIRRYFTIASEPNDPFVRLGVRVPVEGSTFKDALKNLHREAQVSATGVAGVFTLPKDPNQKLAMVAGGIGITPFMSMFRYLKARQERRDMVLIYAVQTPLDFAYHEELEAIQDSIGLEIIFLPTDLTELTGWEGLSGYLTSPLIQKEIPDFKERMWYLSGPDAMVRNYKKLVGGMGIQRGNIKTDYFPGF